MLIYGNIMGRARNMIRLRHICIRSMKIYQWTQSQRKRFSKV